MPRTLSAADRIGIGLAAGLVGTIVMTLGQKAEMAVTKRPASKAPAQAVEKVSGVELASEAEEKRASMPIHFAYGTALGGALAGLDGLREPARTGIFFATAWAGGAALLNALGLAKPPDEQEPAKLATDLGHHFVYAVSAGAAYALLTHFARGTERR